MSSYTREEYIDNLLGRSGGNSKFFDEQLLYLNDMNNGNYSNPLKFSTKAWTDDWMLSPEMYVNIPFIATGSGATAQFFSQNLIVADAVTHKFTSAALDIYDRLKVTNKNGLYSLINSLIVKLNGNTIQNSTDLHISNHLRALTKWSNDYASSTGTIHNFSKDTSAHNDATNLGFQERASISNYSIKITQRPPVTVDRAGYDAALCDIVVEFEVNISLALVSDFFNQLGMPLKNANFELSIGINGLDKLSGRAQEWDCFAIDNVLSTALANGTKTMSFKIGGINPNCKLWCNKVIFMPNDALELDAILNKEGGMQKTVVWDHADVVENTQLPTSKKLDMTISQNIRRPLQVTSFFLPIIAGESTKKMQNMAYPCVTHQGIRHELYGNATPDGVGIVNANLRVDGKKLYEENIDSPFQFYQMFRDQTFAASDDKQIGSLVSYKDFQKLYNYYVFDLTKTAYKITDKPVVIEFLANKVNEYKPTELYHVITTESLTVLNFVEGDIKTTAISNN